MGRLAYETSGDVNRPAILFLHGFMGSARNWETVAAKLGERFYCVAVDLPGHGASLDLSPESYTMEGASRSLAGLLDGLGVGRTVLAGYSMGGRLALYFALYYSEHCSGLFLESASPGLESAEERTARRQADEEKARRLESGDFENFLEDWYLQPLFAPLARNEALLRRTIESRRRNEPEELARALRGMGTGSQPSLWKELTWLKVPTFAVVGELDEKFVGIGRRMETESQAVRFASVPEVGHNVHAEAPDRYIRLLQDFVESI